MKLYTEEQVIIMLNRARLHKQDDTEMFTNEYLLSEEAPIELPSDEEIEARAKGFTDYPYGQAGFIRGTQYMKEQILNQNK